MLADLVVCLALGLASAHLPGERDFTNYTFEQYLAEFSKLPKQYGASDYNSYDTRKQIFMSNLELIKQHNADQSKSWYATVNEFTDWTDEEFRSQHTGRRFEVDEPHMTGVYKEERFVDLPASVDWRTKPGVLTAVKHQRGCGSCWAVSAVETLESMLAIKTGEEAPVLSVQQVVSCSPNPDLCGGTGGCNGSTGTVAFNYTKLAGVVLESDYPYTGRTGTCQKSNIKPVAMHNGYVKLKTNNYRLLVRVVARKGPISVSVATSRGWQVYGGGVFTGKSHVFGNCTYQLNHYVQLVGYGSDDDKLTWIVRNSWGERWGEKGFIRIQRFGNGKEPCGVDNVPQEGEACEGDNKPRTYCGVCGIMGSSSYPTRVRKATPTVVI